MSCQQLLDMLLFVLKGHRVYQRHGTGWRSRVDCVAAVTALTARNFGNWLS